MPLTQFEECWPLPTESLPELQIAFLKFTSCDNQTLVVYSNSCCSCPFEPEIIKIGQSSHKMYSNNTVNFQESTTILNVCTKKSGREDTLKEWYAIKFYFKLGKNATETYGMLQTAFRPSCMNRASVFEWHKRFKEGRESVRDDERCGRSKEVNTPEFIGQRVRIRVTMLRF